MGTEHVVWWIVICFLNNLVKYSSLNIKLKKSSTENPLKVLIGPLFATNGFTATGSRVEFQAASTSLPLFECAKILWVFGIFSWNCYVGFDSTTLLCDWCCISNPENSSLSLSNLNNAAIKKSRPWWLIIKTHQAKHFLGGFWWFTCFKLEVLWWQMLQKHAQMFWEMNRQKNQ